MKMKKLMSLVMACAMVMALASTALAAETDLDHSTTLAGATQGMDISLTVLTTSQTIVFNPYKIEVKTNASTGALAADGAAAGNDQFIAKTQVIKNKTNVPLKLTATFAMTVEGAEGDVASIAKAAPAATVTAKQVYMYADFAVFDAKGEANAPVEPPDTRPEAWLTASRLVGAAGTSGEDGWTGGTKHAATGVVNIPAAAGKDNDAGANFVFIKLGGNATAAPTKPWTSADKVTVGLVYSFAPQASYDKYKIVLTKADVDDATVYFTSSDATPTFTIPYQSANIDVAKGGSTTLDARWYDGNGKVIAGNILSGYQILIHCPADGNTGKYFPITAVTFKNQDGTVNSTLKAAKVDSKKATTDWSFTMPAQNVQCLVTVGETSQ